jgi:endoglucanase
MMVRILALLSGFGFQNVESVGMSLPMYTASGGVVRMNGESLSIKGINYFGFETGTRVCHGLWQTSLLSILDTLRNERFNALRIPFSNDLVIGTEKVPSGVDYAKNPYLVGKTSLQVLDFLVDEAARRGMLIMLDSHKFVADMPIPEKWYDMQHMEREAYDTWQVLISRYAGSWNVFAIDIINEPHGMTMWEEWSNFATTFGNWALTKNARLLIFVEGTSRYRDYETWWGGNLRGVKDKGISLDVKDKVVYSPHVYGPSVFMATPFADPTFPENMPAIWDADFGYIQGRLGTVVPGEWGGFSSGLTAKWLERVVTYFIKSGITSTFFWDVNPNSKDTHGLLLDDWVTLDEYKRKLLETLNPNPTDILRIYDATSRSSNASKPFKPSRPLPQLVTTCVRTIGLWQQCGGLSNCKAPTCLRPFAGPWKGSCCAAQSKCVSMTPGEWYYQCVPSK